MRRAICLFAVFCLSKALGLVYDNDLSEVYRTVVNEAKITGFVRISNDGDISEIFRFSKNGNSDVDVKIYVDGVEAPLEQDFTIGKDEIRIAEFRAISDQPSATTSRVDVDVRRAGGYVLDKMFLIKTIISGKGNYSLLHPGFEKDYLIVKGAGEQSLAGKANMIIRNIGNAGEYFRLNIGGDNQYFSIYDGSEDVTNGVLRFLPNEIKELSISCNRAEAGQVDVSIFAVGSSDNNQQHLASVVCVIDQEELLQPFTFKYDTGKKQMAQTRIGKDFKIANALNEDNLVVSHIINVSPVQESILIRSSEAVQVFKNGITQPIIHVGLPPEHQTTVDIKCNKNSDEIYGYVVYEDTDSNIIDVHTVECVNQNLMNTLRFEGATYHHIETTVGSQTQDVYHAMLTNLGNSKAFLNFDYDMDLFEVTNEVRLIGVSEDIDSLKSMNLRISCKTDGVKQISGEVKIASGGQAVALVEVSCDVDTVLRKSLVVTGLDETLELENNHYFTVHNNGQTTEWVRFVTNNPQIRIFKNMVDQMNDQLITLDINENLLFDISCGGYSDSQDNYVSLFVMKNRVFQAYKTVKVNCHSGVSARRALRGNI